MSSYGPKSAADSLPLVINEDAFTNGYAIRLNRVRSHYGLTTLYADDSLTKGKRLQLRHLNEKDLSEIVDLYTTWRDTDEKLVVRYTFRISSYVDFSKTPIDIDAWCESYSSATGLVAARFNDNPNCKVIACEKDVSQWAIKTCPKRGNPVYTAMFKKNMKPLQDAAKRRKSFFSTCINKNRKRVRRTHLLYVTGTCDRSKTGSVSDSWLQFGEYWRCFVTNIRQQFQGCEFFRVWQSQKNGYPHFHALVYFPNFEFSVVPWLNQSGKWEFRVHNRQKHNGVLVHDRLNGAWKWGHLDFKCCDSTKKAFRDVLKYVTRDLDGGESDLTNALIWYFGKQSYSISDKFTTLLLGKNIAMAEPCDDDLISAYGAITSDNCNRKLIRIEIFPTILGDSLPKFIQKSIDDFDFGPGPPDPPPEIVAFLDNYACSCSVSKLDINDDGVEIVVYRRGDGF